ncbi:hypothetical protein LshimejAT787_0605300 [Lyophyllum shimeji]|uniref:Uncharacterized protein n=1 Tax=Lyophyllum shimeji TaxID=47721 RepID=A0A9P3UN70_LYOSH|nr:hypothetical protein LshimejAT787_0605300 [Lyophyllum shimeji]
MERVHEILRGCSSCEQYAAQIVRTQSQSAQGSTRSFKGVGRDSRVPVEYYGASSGGTLPKFRAGLDSGEAAIATLKSNDRNVAAESSLPKVASRTSRGANIGGMASVRWKTRGPWSLLDVPGNQAKIKPSAGGVQPIVIHASTMI